MSVLVVISSRGSLEGIDGTDFDEFENSLVCYSKSVWWNYFDRLENNVKNGKVFTSVQLVLVN